MATNERPPLPKTAWDYKDICFEWSRRPKDERRSYLPVLAQLNGASVKDIRRILVEIGGEDPRSLPRAARNPEHADYTREEPAKAEDAETPENKEAEPEAAEEVIQNDLEEAAEPPTVPEEIEAQKEINLPGPAPQDPEGKKDAGKPHPSWVPGSLIRAVMEIREMGTRKYGSKDNWKGVPEEMFFEAFLRHVLAVWEHGLGHVDEESGLPTLWHIACNLAFLIEMEEMKKRNA